uniref:helix-turn-helix domain-containing protein n=1 Tax=Aerosakkonema funiforme TaxID=1246630 RepID=UPI001689F606|nr:helix-turn-helix domain-containing protein [Aerosakkonema funiforme]
MSKYIYLSPGILNLIVVLSDQVREGTPNLFSTEQVIQIVALACEKPVESERPVSHWTPGELPLLCDQTFNCRKYFTSQRRAFFKKRQLYNPIVIVIG